jgi:hypothetical protein
MPVQATPFCVGGHWLRWPALICLWPTGKYADALAVILRELAGTGPTGSWGVWAADAPTGRISLDSPAPTTVTGGLTGSKCWCSGAASTDNALRSLHGADDGAALWLAWRWTKQLALKSASPIGRAVGMAGSASLDVQFNGSEGHA